MEPELRNITCPRCGGAGSIKQESEDVSYKATTQGKMTQYDITFEFTMVCPKCRGVGKVDWISNVVGSKELVITSTQGEYKWKKL